MPAVTRELSVVYGSTTVGGGTEYLLEFPLSIRKDYIDFEIRFPFVLTATSGADFASQIDAVEDAFREKNNRVQVLQDGNTLFDANPADNSGFNTTAEISKIGTEGADSGRSRRYEVTIRGQLPADETGKSGRQDSTIELGEDSARRQTVTISGRYTALSSNDARAQYDASIAAYASTVLTAIDSSATFELIDEMTTNDDEDKNLDFVRVYREILYNQSSGTLDDTSIVSDVIRVSRVEDRPGDTPIGNPKRLIQLNCTYTAWIDKTESTDLESKWENTIRGYLVDTVADSIQSGSKAVVVSAPDYNFSENSISATLTIWARNGSSVIEMRKSTTYDTNFGIQVRNVHADDPFAAYEYQGPGERLITEEYEFKAFGFIQAQALEANGIDAVAGGGNQGPNIGQNNNQGGGGDGPPNPNPGAKAGGKGARGGPGNGGGSGSRLLSRTASATHLKVGDDSDNFDITEGRIIDIRHWFRGFKRGQGASGNVVSPR
jgi:hypothetical protein